MPKELSREEMFALAVELRQTLKGAILEHFIGVGTHTFLLQFDKQSLLISLQAPYLRFHLFTGDYEPKETPFSKEINKSIQGLKLIDAEILNNDRILQLHFANFDLVAEFFPKKPNFYLLNDEKRVLFSLNPTEHAFYKLPENLLSNPIELLPSISSETIQARYDQLEQEVKNKAEKRELEKFFKGKLNQLNKGLKGSEEHLKQCLHWKEVHQKGLLIQSNLYQIKRGMSEILVPDWEKGGEEVKIPLDPSKEPFQQVEALFKKSKKLKSGIPHAEKRVKELNEQLDHWTSLYDKFKEASQQDDQGQFLYLLKKKISPVAEARKSLPYREYLSASGLRIWVGKSGTSNDKLTFTLSRGSDWWFHVNGYAGSHVILKVEKNKDPDEEAVKDALLLAVVHSKGKDKGSVEVCVTQCKFVSRIGKQKSGKVQISKHRNRKASFDPVRLNQIKQRHSNE